MILPKIHCPLIKLVTHNGIMSNVSAISTRHKFAIILFVKVLRVGLVLMTYRTMQLVKIEARKIIIAVKDSSTISTLFRPCESPLSDEFWFC